SPPVVRTCHYHAVQVVDGIRRAVSHDEAQAPRDQQQVPAADRGDVRESSRRPRRRPGTGTGLRLGAVLRPRRRFEGHHSLSEKPPREPGLRLSGACRELAQLFDDARGDAQAAELRKSAAALDWAAVESALRSTGDRTRREFLVDAVALGSTDLKWVDRWVQERPDEPLARLLWGACGVHYAWHVRSGAEPKYVSSDQMKGFHEWLGHAEDQLQHAIVLDPNDSAPWIALLWSAVGLGLPLEEATSRWE